MNNNLSIKRSEKLTEYADDFLRYKLSYMNKNNSNNGIVKCNKEKIMKYLCASNEDWEDWHWQISNRINQVNQLSDLFDISSKELENINKVSLKYRWEVSPYYLSQIINFNKSDPIYEQCIPQIDELCSGGVKDPMNEINNRPAGIITRRYPDRVILNITNCCASFCRHCQRKRNIGEIDDFCSEKSIDESLKFIQSHPEIRDVLITGGDPLTLEDEYIENLLAKIKSINTVEIIRIGTRTLVTLPQRITDKLVKILKKYDPIYINTQFNHPNEINQDVRKACKKLTDNGIVLGNQMVFLNNINNDYYIVQLLNQMLVQLKIRPYYIFHPKDVVGTKHFSISIEEGINIFNKLRGNTSGLAIPTYVYNSANGLGKIPLTSQILELQDKEHNVVLKTWEGKQIKINIERKI